MTRKLCNEPNCHSGAIGKLDKCIAHGGGKRCNEPNCHSSSVGKTDKCVAHGGGNVVANRTVIQVQSVKLINVLHMEVENDVMNRIVNQAQ